MEVEENLQLIRARYDAVNAHDLDKFQGFYADSTVWSDPGLPAPITGARSVRKRLEVLTTAFPDLHWELDKIFSQGENVCAEFVFTGTHRGELPDDTGEKSVPATNKPVQLQACGVYVVREGKIIDSKIYFDFGHLYRKLRSADNDA
jgi:steroid delta-isomerase-like uncharacterized protein